MRETILSSESSSYRSTTDIFYQLTMISNYVIETIINQMLFSPVICHRFICISYYLQHVLHTDLKDIKVNKT